MLSHPASAACNQQVLSLAAHFRCLHIIDQMCCSTFVIPARQQPAPPANAQSSRTADAAHSRSDPHAGGTFMTPVAPLRPEWEVADVIRQYGEAFLNRHGSWLSGTQTQTLRDLARCRTQALGGHVERCLDCGRERIAYNSCRNRHCPKCQAMTRAGWLVEQASHLLPVEYFHVVFTLPSEVAELTRVNRVALYDLLFQAASATLREVAANPKRLGAQ